MSFKDWPSWAVLVLLCGLLSTGFAQASVPAKTIHHPPAKVTKTGKTQKTAKTVAQSVNPNTVIATYNHAVMAYRLQHDAESEASLRKALLLSKNAKGLPPKITGSIDHLLGFALYREGKKTEAISYLKRALAIMSRPENALANQSMVMDETLLLGQAAMLTGNYTEAEQYCRTAAPLAEKILGPDNQRTKQNQGFLADLQKMDSGTNYLNVLSTPNVIHWVDAYYHPIVIYIADGSDVPGWKPSDKEVVHAAYQEWETALEGLVRFEFTDNPEQADTIVSWMPQPAALEESLPGGSKELASGACRSKQNNHYLIDDNIVIAVNDTKGKPFSDIFIRNTSLHEIEHSLGAMHGHSTVPTDILFFSSKYDDGHRKAISARDIATMKALYALRPDIANPAGIHLVRFSHYMDEIKIASDSYNEKNYPLAYVHYTKALRLYDQDPETRFFMGMSLWNLKRFDEATPYFLSVNGHRQSQAMMMAGNTLIQSGKNDENTGNQPLALDKYHHAYQLLTQALQVLPSTSNNNDSVADAQVNENCQKQIQWLNQRFASQSTPYIQWSNPANSVPQPTESAQQKPWFQFW